jgi:phospholipid/cholesterol/gamma-HCH transport system substrate-binding protein
MISRSTWTQLLVFAVISVLGVTYAGVRYAGLGRYFTDTGYLVSADFADSGGIFQAAQVTYRGVLVGTVEDLTLNNTGVRVTMRLKPGTQVPDDARALVANRSAVGEQYVDLQPQRKGGPYLRAGEVIPTSRTAVPIQPAQLVVNLDDLAKSIDTRDLAVVLDELGKAFNGAGDSLQRLVDNGNLLTQAALQNIGPTTRLIQDGKTVLDTQRDVSGQFRSFNRDLSLLAQTLRSSDPDFRRLYTNGTESARQVTALIDSNRTALPVLMDNLISFAQVQNVRLPAIRQILVTYPNVVAGGFTVVPGDGTSHFGLVQSQQPGICTTPQNPNGPGYYNAQRNPSDESLKPKSDAYCTQQSPSPIDVRGARNAPRPDGLPPFPEDRQPANSQTSGDVVNPLDEVALADYDPISGHVITSDGQRFTLGSTAGAGSHFGSGSWRWLLLNPLSK